MRKHKNTWGANEPVERETGLEPATTCLEGCPETSYQSLASFLRIA
jgi:hypothetical protein